MSNQTIPNIYVYCDRWCERCAFASKCEGYAATEKFTGDKLRKKERENRLFWNRLREYLKESSEYINNRAKEKGKDLLLFEDVPRQVKFDLFQRKAVSNDVLKAGRKYEDKVDDLLDKLVDNGLLAVVETGSGGAYKIIGTPENGIDPFWVNEMLTVILRYQLQLYLKISRGYYSRGKAAENTEDSAAFSNDATGAIKSAVELIERSLAAWFVCLKAFAVRFHDEIEDILFLLTTIKNNLIKEFPEASSFVRPGLDEFF